MRAALEVGTGKGACSWKAREPAITLSLMIRATRTCAILKHSGAERRGNRSQNCSRKNKEAVRENSLIIGAAWATSDKRHSLVHVMEVRSNRGGNPSSERDTVLRWEEHTSVAQLAHEARAAKTRRHFRIRCQQRNRRADASIRALDGVAVGDAGICVAQPECRPRKRVLVCNTI